MIRRLLLLCALIVGVPALLASGAAAHSGFQSYVYVSVFDDSMSGRIEYPVADLGAALEVDFPDDESGALAVARERFDLIVDYTVTHLSIGDGAGDWELVLDDEFTFLPVPAGDYLQFPFEVEGDFDGGVPRRLVVTYDGIIEDNPERDALFLVEDDWGSATFRNEDQHIASFSVGQTTQTIELDDASTVSAMWEIGNLGFDAVDAAADQVLVVIALLAPVALVGAGRRRDDPAPSLSTVGGGSGRRIAILLASQAVVVAVLGLAGAAPSATATGVAVALGLAAAVVSGWLTTGAGEVAVGLAGVLSGLGLASTFVELQLDRARPLRSVVAFELGVVVAVILATVLVLPALVLLGRLRAAVTIFRVLSALLGMASLVWIVERVGDFDFPLRNTEKYGVQWLTHPVVMAVVTASVAGLVAVAAGRGGIRTVDGPAPGQAVPVTPERDRMEV